MKDCSDCVLWSPWDECCTADELYEYDPEEFFVVCPKCNGDLEFKDEAE